MRPRNTSARLLVACAGCLIALALALCVIGGCPAGEDSSGSSSLPVFNNTTDPTNGGASYVGSQACGACHADVAAVSLAHGHSQVTVPTDVTCETCHGPGSNHLPRTAARDLFVDPTSETCARCHLAGDDPNVIVATDGYVDANTQYAEVLASGGHADFSCMFCHDPHASATYDRERGIRNTCSVCHTDANMAAHGGVVFVRGSYRETMTCESCHMPFAGLRNAAAGLEIVGGTGRMGDVRSHIFRIAAQNADYTAMFSADGSRVVKDEQGRAAVTVDFVCLRCHTDDTAVDNSAFYLSLESAWQIATGLHRLPQ